MKAVAECWNGIRVTSAIRRRTLCLKSCPLQSFNSTKKYKCHHRREAGHQKGCSDTRMRRDKAHG